MIFEPLFHDSEYVRTKIRRMTAIGLVCKAWMPAAEAVAVDVFRLDPRDRDAVAYFDPAGSGAGAKLLLLVHTCSFVNTSLQRQADLLLNDDDAETDEEEDSGSEDRGAAQEDEKPNLQLETDISTRTVDILLAMLLRMPNIQELRTAYGIESTIKRAFCTDDPGSVWPRLVRIYLLWGRSIPRVYPLLAKLPCFTSLESFDLWFSPGRLLKDDTSDDDDDEDEATAIEAATKTIRPLHTLQEIVVTAFETKPELLEPVVSLLLPAAPLRVVSWLSPVPPGLFPRLSQGKKPIRRLTLGCFARPERHVRKVWPQLRNLGTTRPIMNLCVDLPSNGDNRDDLDDDDDDEDDFPAILTIEEFLRDIPLSVRSVETTYTAKDQDRDPYMFSIGSGPYFRAMLARPRPPFLTIRKDGTVSTDWNDKTRAQTVMLSMRALAEDTGAFTTDLTLARYHVGPGSAHLSEWHIVSSDIVDRHRQLDPLAGPEAMVDLIARGMRTQPL